MYFSCLGVGSTIPVPQHTPTWHQCWLSLIMRECWRVFLPDDPYLLVGNKKVLHILPCPREAHLPTSCCLISTFLNTSELNAPWTCNFNELARLFVSFIIPFIFHVWFIKCVCMRITKLESFPYGGSVIRLLKLCALYVNHIVPAFSLFTPTPQIWMYHVNKSIPKMSLRKILHIN